MKPRILAVIRWPVGGIRTWCRYIYTGELFDSFSIELLMPSVPEAAALERDLKGTGVACHFVDEDRRSGRFITAAMKVLLTRNASLVHSHGFTSAIAASLPCLVRRIPHLVTTHDVILDDQFRDVRGRVARHVLSWVLRGADCVQAVSAASATNLVHAFPRVFHMTNKLVTIRNGIDVNEFRHAERVDLRTMLGVPEEALLVGFFGRFMAPKGFRYLVRAVELDVHRQSEARPPIYVVAVGSGGFRREEEAALRSAGISDRFRFVDFTPKVAELIASVDVVVMPSLWEACGLLAMEAMVTGTPLVAGDCEALVQLCEHSPARVVRPKDSEQLWRAIHEQGSEAARAAAREYRNSAAEVFDVEKSSAQLFELYQRLMA